MSVPEISIVVPVYRTDPKLFEQCLDSLTRQGLSAGEWELIIVFDGPQDAALFDVCERFGHEHGNNVTQIMSDTRGVSAARNAGMDRASGKWLAFLDSDDSLPDSALSLMMRYADDHTCDIVMGDHTSVLGTGREFHPCHASEEILEGARTRLFCRDILSPQANAGLVWGKLYRRALIKEKDIWFNESIAVAEDSDFVFRVAIHAKRIGYLRQNVYLYQRNANSAVRAFRFDYVERIIKSMAVMKRDLTLIPDGNAMLDDYESYVAFHLLLILVNYLFNPQAPWSRKERRNQYYTVLKQPIFAECLQKVYLRRFTLTRKVSLITLRYKCYFLSAIIGAVRQKQLN